MRDTLLAETTLAAALLTANRERYVKKLNEFTMRFETVVDFDLLRADVKDYLDGKKMRSLHA